MKKATLKTKESNAKVNNQVENKAVKVIKKTIAKKATETKKVEHPKAKEQKVIKEVETQQKTASLVEAVTAHREVKYLYPSDVTDTLSRKQWRQKVRNKLHKLEVAFRRIQDQNTEESKAAQKAFEDYRAQVMKPAAELV